MVTATHVPPLVDHPLDPRGPNVGVEAMTALDLGAPATDGEPLWVISLLANDLWQDPPSCVDEPVADLKHGEARLLRQTELLSVAGVGVIAVVIQPPPQHQYRLLAEVAPPLPGYHGLAPGTPGPALLGAALLLPA